MKRLFITGVIAAMAFSTVAKAELEISGNVTTMVGYQHDDADATVTGTGGGLTMGDWGIAPATNADHFRFVLDQVEIDLDNEFGENIRARADIDFRDVAGTVLRAGDVMDLEQGYVTANLGVGNGMEFLIGKFTIPLGLESSDRHENVFSTYTPGWTFLIPTSIIGSKIYYEFNDNWNFDFGVVNNLNGAIAGNSAIPSALLRVGAVWGDDDASYWNFAVAGGPEHSAVSGGSNNAHYDMLGDMWGNFSLGDYWDLGWEVTYRTSNTVTGTTNQRAFAGQLYAVYEASDAWTVQARVAALDEVSGFAAGTSGASTTGATWSGGPKGLTYSGTLGATYNIADDAAMKWEFRYDLVDPSAGAKADYWTGVAEFAYSF